MISDLILIAKKFSVPSAYGRRDGVRDFFAQYPDGVYIATDAGAPAGWEGYAVWFGGAGERYAERFMEFIRDVYIVERFLRARVGGLLVFTFRCRLKMRRFGTLGKPYRPDALNFYMPNGGTISLNKTGSPTVVELEYSLDGGATWTVWPEDGSGNRSLTLTAGQRMYVRNTSVVSTGFNTSTDDYYNFSSTDDMYASGNVNSLICKIPSNAVISSYCYYNLFKSAQYLITPPTFPSTTIADGCYRATFYDCIKMIRGVDLPATSGKEDCYRSFYYGCVSLVVPGTISMVYPSKQSLNYMYQGCSSLVTPPVMKLAYTADSCCRYMFSNCTALTSIADFTVNNIAVNAFRSMYSGCNSLVSAVVKATRIAGNYALYSIFDDCSNLSSVTLTATSVTGLSVFINWLRGVAATGDLYCDSNLTLIANSSSGIPTGWTRHDI